MTRPNIRTPWQRRWVSYSPAYHGATPEVVPAAPQPSDNDLAVIPDWPSLFGSLDFCACKHCQSVYSPAAYLVDVLHFLKDVCPAKAPHKNAKDVLFDRRSDIGKIELTCANTNTPVPYIDLVNEILENAVAPSGIIKFKEVNKKLHDHGIWMIYGEIPEDARSGQMDFGIQYAILEVKCASIDGKVNME